MKDIIQDRLNMVSDLNERRLLRSILDVHKTVENHNMEMYKVLEKNLHKEIEDPLHKFYIYVSMETIENISLEDDFLSPICQNDVKKPHYTIETINETIEYEGEFIVTSIFMECKTLIIQKILKERGPYKCTIKTDKGIYNIDATLKYSYKYINEIKNLYKTFRLNNIEWCTVNCPYAYKFVDIILESKLNIQQEEKILEINVDLGKYEKYKRTNVIPLWNVKNIIAINKNFSLPSKDGGNFVNSIPLHDFGVENGYLVAYGNKNYVHSKCNDKEFIIVSKIQEEESFNIVQIKSSNNFIGKKYSYELLSATRNLGFIGRYTLKKALIIRTIGEIARILQSYEVSEALTFKKVEVVDKYIKPIQTINFNSFIDDDIRIDSYKRIMLIIFTSNTDKDNFLIWDKMSFLVSEIQFLFPEYNCIGDLE